MTVNILTRLHIRVYMWRSTRFLVQMTSSFFRNRCGTKIIKLRLETRLKSQAIWVAEMATWSPFQPLRLLEIWVWSPISVLWSCVLMTSFGPKISWRATNTLFKYNTSNLVKNQPFYKILYFFPLKIMFNLMWFAFYYFCNLHSRWIPLHKCDAPRDFWSKWRHLDTRS